MQCGSFFFRLWFGLGVCCGRYVRDLVDKCVVWSIRVCFGRWVCGLADTCVGSASCVWWPADVDTGASVLYVRITDGLPLHFNSDGDPCQPPKVPHKDSV
jgi:hypothetical protein